MFAPVIDFEALLPFIRDGAIFVFLSVQGLKLFQVVKEGYEGRFALGSAGVFGALSAVKIAYSPSAPYIDIFFCVYVGAMVAGLFYRYLVRPLFKELGWPISNDELNG